MAKSKISKAKKASAKKSIRRQRPLRKRLLLHPLFMFGLLCAGVLIAGSTFKALADSSDVVVTVKAAAFHKGATIIEPADGDKSSKNPFTVRGTCLADTYVRLYRNGIFSGSAWCLQNGTFSIETGLSAGINKLVAQAYNQADQQGPDTPSVRLIYSVSDDMPGDTTAVLPPGADKILVPAEASIISPDAKQSGPGMPLLLTSDYSFSAFATGTDFSWTFDLGGGRPPYKLVIDWGDDTISRLTFVRDPVFKISHKYKLADYYPVKIRVIDADGTVTSLQVAALIKHPGDKGFILSAAQKSPPEQGLKMLVGSVTARLNQWLWIAWPTYGVLMLMTVSFLLGERREYVNLVYPRRTGRKRAA
jgi:hypothetical protein